MRVANMVGVRVVGAIQPSRLFCIFALSKDCHGVENISLPDAAVLAADWSPCVEK